MAVAAQKANPAVSLNSSAPIEQDFSSLLLQLVGVTVPPPNAGIGEEAQLPLLQDANAPATTSDSTSPLPQDIAQLVGQPVPPTGLLQETKQLPILIPGSEADVTSQLDQALKILQSKCNAAEKDPVNSVAVNGQLPQV